jgi:spore coat polysaccharide biosynthesis predicted glycosyltransferase SpsG
MHLHIISSISLDNLIKSDIASHRLRLSYLYDAAKELGHKVTSGVNKQVNADIYYFGKVTKDMTNKVLDIIPDLKRKNLRVLFDYTDDIISHKNEEKRKFIYEELLKINSTITVPVYGLGDKFNKIGKKVYVIPDGIDDFSNFEPSNKNNNEKNVLWVGHNSNINSLIRIISNELVEYKFNLHVVSNVFSFNILKKTRFDNIPKCKPILHMWSIEKLKNLSKVCDFAILPTDKQWASANRLITNFRLGLPIIAETISSYSDFSEYYCNFNKKQITKMFNFPETWHKSVKLAQVKIDNEYNRQKLIKLWKKILV